MGIGWDLGGGGPSFPMLQAFYENLGSAGELGLGQPFFRQFDGTGTTVPSGKIWFGFAYRISGGVFLLNDTAVGSDTENYYPANVIGVEGDTFSLQYDSGRALIFGMEIDKTEVNYDTDSVTVPSDTLGFAFANNISQTSISGVNEEIYQTGYETTNAYLPPGESFTGTSSELRTIFFDLDGANTTGLIALSDNESYTLNNDLWTFIQGVDDFNINDGDGFNGTFGFPFPLPLQSDDTVKFIGSNSTGYVWGIQR